MSCAPPCEPFSKAAKSSPAQKRPGDALAITHLVVCLGTLKRGQEAVHEPPAVGSGDCPMNPGRLCCQLPASPQTVERAALVAADIKTLSKQVKDRNIRPE